MTAEAVLGTKNYGYVEPYIFRQLPIEVKSDVLRGNYMHAAKVLHDWNEERKDVLNMDPEDLWDYMLKEWEEFEDEVRNQRELPPLSGKIDNLWELPDARARLAVAQEAADVMIFAGDILIANKWFIEQIAEFWQNAEMNSRTGRSAEMENFVAQCRMKCEELAVDPATIIFEKVLINDQHYPRGFKLGENDLRAFMKPIRRAIGDDSSAIPPLVQSKWGETPGARANKTVFGENGYVPKAFDISHSGVTVIRFSDEEEDYLQLYN